VLWEKSASDNDPILAKTNSTNILPMSLFQHLASVYSSTGSLSSPISGSVSGSSGHSSALLMVFSSYAAAEEFAMREETIVGGPCIVKGRGDTGNGWIVQGGGGVYF